MERIEISKEMFCEWKEKTQSCGNCKHYEGPGGACKNSDSEYRADFVGICFVCDKWEEKQ